MQSYDIAFNNHKEKQDSEFRVLSSEFCGQSLPYEFYAKPENRAIPIPEHYKNLITDNVQKKTDLLPPPAMKTKGFKFNREEANER